MRPSTCDHCDQPATIHDTVVLDGLAVRRNLCTAHGGPAWDEAAFTALYDKVRADLYDLSADTTLKTATVLIAFHRASGRLKAVSSPVLLNAVNDVRLHLASLVYPGFVTETGWQRLPDLKRYLLAVDRRLEALPGFGKAKSRIFVGLLGKRLGIRPEGWETVAADWPSIADVAKWDDIATLREQKRAMKQAGSNPP